MHRLKTAEVIGISAKVYDYNSIGNITKKSDFSSLYNYDQTGNAGPNAVTSATLITGPIISYEYDARGNRITDTVGTVPRASYQYDYNNLLIEASSSISNGDVQNLEFNYGPDNQRYRKYDENKNEITLYANKDYEQIYKNGFLSQYKYYITSYMTITNGITKTFMQKDRLGSTTQILDESGNVLHTKSYDAFGKPRNGDWSDTSALFQAKLEFSDPNGTIDITKRGFTDHEHLDDMQLIHMNGRMYDYNNGRFLSVDPFIQDPTSTQAMNPYSYLGNNPLSGTDPTGYLKAQCGKEICNIKKVERVNRPGSRIKGSGIKFSGTKESGGKFSISVDSATGEVFNSNGIDSITITGASTKSGKGISDTGKPSNVSKFLGAIVDNFSEIVQGAVNGAIDQATDETSQLIAKTIISAVDPREDFKEAKNCVFGDGSCLGTAINIISRKLDAVVDVYKVIKRSGVCCFVAGTQVLTKDGYKNIEDVKLGELVWAKNVETGESDWKPVSKIYVEHDRGIYHIRLRKSDGNIINIEATDDHPFYVVDHGWKTTVELQVNDKIETKEVGSVVVVSVEDEHREDTTYNFEIADFHTYYVTEFGVLVHNGVDCDPKLTNSTHANVRKTQGRLTSTAYSDLQNARNADIFVQADGRFVIRGRNSREHIIDANGELITTINKRTKKAHQNLIGTERFPATVEEIEKVKSFIGN